MDKIVFWGIIAIAAMVIGQRLYRYFHNSGQPQHSLPVLVANKRTREFMGKTRKEQTEMPPPRVQYYVSFRQQNENEEREFRVTQHLYEQLEQEQTGTLVFQGRRFIAFEPDETILDND